MTKEEIVKLAEQAGLIYWTRNRWWIDAGEPDEDLEDFVRLIQARTYGDAYRAGADAERKACAMICEAEAIDPEESDQWSGCAQYLANNIRARS